jgi:cysteine-rich repeat protein
MDGLTGVGDDDDTMGGGVCGNGTVEAGENCDDGNAAGGDGCSASCQTEAGTQPRLDVSVDKPTIATELKTTHQITMTLTGVGGFGETVNVAASVVDATDTSLPGWTVTLANPTVDVPMNGMATLVATLKVPSQNVGLIAKVKLDVTSTLGAKTVTTDVTATNQVTFTLHVDNASGNCVYPTDGGSTTAKVMVSNGTKIRWFNDGTADLEIHVNGSPVASVTHQGQSPNGLTDPKTEANTAYEQTPNASTGTVTWYCHAPGIDMGMADPSIQLTN